MTTASEHIDAATLDQRLDTLLTDVEAEEREAKEAFDAAKARHDAASKRARAIRTAHETLHGNGKPRQPEAENGETVNGEHARRVLEARGAA